MFLLWLFLLALAGSLYCSGMIWVLHFVHYALYEKVGPDAFAEYMRAHNRSIAIPIILPSLITFLAVALTPLSRPTPSPLCPFVVCIALQICVLLSTAVWQGSAHRALEAGFDAARVRTLLATNWIRIVAHTTTALILLFELATFLNQRA